MPAHHQYTQEQVDDALTALIAFAGNANAAVRWLKENDKPAPASSNLTMWARTRHWERYEELREQFSARRESTLANNYLDASLRATEAMVLAADKAMEKLEAGKDEDPARTAANLATVARSATDKRLVLQNRPTQIHETRDLSAILRSLAAKGVIEVPDVPGEIEAGDG